MAIIIETCPKCGHDLVDEVLCTYPPIPKKSCWSCGWSWTGKPEQVMRVPFGGNSLDDDKTWLHGNTDYECVNGLATTITTCGEKAINTGEILDTLTKAFEKSYREYEDKFMQESLKQGF